METEEDNIWDSLGPEAPKANGLYDPSLEKEACGVGFVVQIDGIRSNKVKRSLLWYLYWTRSKGFQIYDFRREEKINVKFFFCLFYVYFCVPLDPAGCEDAFIEAHSPGSHIQWQWHGRWSRRTNRHTPLSLRIYSQVLND